MIGSVDSAENMEEQLQGPQSVIPKEVTEARQGRRYKQQPHLSGANAVSKCCCCCCSAVAAAADAVAAAAADAVAAAAALPLLLLLMLLLLMLLLLLLLLWLA